MKRHRIHLALFAAAVAAASGAMALPQGERTGEYNGPGAAGSGVSGVEQQGGAPIVDAELLGAMAAIEAGGPNGAPRALDDPPATVISARTGGGEGSSRANSNQPTGIYSGAGAGGSGTALPNLGRGSEQVASEQHARAEDRFQDRRTMSELLGAPVRNGQGEKIGEIEEVVLDPQGNPTLAIVSTGGFLGIGERMHAVPYEALELGSRGNDRVLDMSREQLRDAPSFSSSERPNMNDPAWQVRNMRSYEPR